MNAVIDLGWELIQDPEQDTFWIFFAKTVQDHRDPSAAFHLAGVKHMLLPISIYMVAEYPTDMLVFSRKTDGSDTFAKRMSDEQQELYIRILNITKQNISDIKQSV